MKKSYGPLTLGQALDGAHVCLGNATELLDDALMFLKEKKYSKSFALCEIANEELGKISILIQIYLTSSKKSRLLEILVKKDKRFKKLKNKNELQILWDAFYQHEFKTSFAMMKIAQEKTNESGIKFFGQDVKNMGESQKMVASILLVYANPSILDQTDSSQIEKKNDCFYVNYNPSTGEWSEPNRVINGVEALDQMKITRDLMKSYVKALENIRADIRSQIENLDSSEEKK